MRAMVLAAGLGTRMRPLSEHTPKPLIEVASKPLIDWSLDALVQTGVRHIVVNVSYLAEQIEAHIAQKTDADYTISHEPTPLETGGGIKQALPYLGDAPFIVMNSDAFCMDGAEALNQLQEHADGAPITLLLQPKEQAVGYHGAGDFFCDAAGNLRRRTADETEAPYVFTGIQLLAPSIFEGSPEDAFSMNVLYNKNVNADGTLQGVKGCVHTGTWLHVGTPQEKAQAEAFLAKN